MIWTLALAIRLGLSIHLPEQDMMNEVCSVWARGNIDDLFIWTKFTEVLLKSKETKHFYHIILHIQPIY